MAFLSGQRLSAQYLNSVFMPPTSDVENTSGTTTSTTYVETLTSGTACSLTFTAPLSGVVIVTNSLQTSNSGANTAVCSWIIRNGAVIGSGTTFLDGGDAKAIVNLTGVDAVAKSHIVSGLTPLAVYNIRQQFKCNGGTATFVNKELLVTPSV